MLTPTAAKWFDTLRGLGNATLDLVFPPRCQACREFDAEPLCEKCSAQIVLLVPPLCEVCGAPLEPLARAGNRCANCRRDRCHFERCRSAARYEGPLRDAIHAFKFDSRTVLARPFGQLLCDCLDDAERGFEASGADVVIPVPLQRRRRRQRGYNQAELLAREVAAHLGVAVAVKPFVRERITADQIGLTRRQRKENVRGAFRVIDDSLRGKTILLIDDVLTTGATMNECARTLRRAGALRVFGLTLARQV